MKVGVSMVISRGVEDNESKLLYLLEPYSAGFLCLPGADERARLERGVVNCLMLHLMGVLPTGSDADGDYYAFIDTAWDSRRRLYYYLPHVVEWRPELKRSRAFMPLRIVVAERREHSPDETLCEIDLEAGINVCDPVLGPIDFSPIWILNPANLKAEREWQRKYIRDDALGSCVCGPLVLGSKKMFPMLPHRVILGDLTA